MIKQLLTLSLLALCAIAPLGAKTPSIVRPTPLSALPPAWDGMSSARGAQFDSRVRVYLSPTRIVWQQSAERITGAEYLLRPGNGQADLENARICVVRGQGDERPAVLLDFGREMQGGIRIVTGMPADHRPVRVRVRFGESVSEAMSEIDGVNGASNDHAMRDFVLALPWLGCVEAGNSGFRFVRIDLLDEDRELHLKEVNASLIYRDVPYLGSFRSNDERLNEIWMTGAYTVHLNMQEYLWDAVKRDRLVWVGDLHPEVMTVSSVFGANEVVPRSLDLARDTTPLPGWMNGISSYSLWWILIHRDWYYYQGDKEYLREQQPYLTELLRQVISKIGPGGGEQLDGMRFLDWPSSDDAQGVGAGLQALMVMTLDAGAELCAELGDGDLAAECRERAAAMRRCVPDPGRVKQGAALMALSGLADPGKMDREVLSVGGSAGFSTFYGYYMLRAMAAAGNYTGALERIREFWGAMLDLGATTFWEDFNMEWLPAARIDEPVPAGMRDLHRECGAYCYQGYRHSFAHGWASGPTAWLSEYVLGIQVLEPGCRRIRIEPHLGDLEWAEGSFPTPYGVVEVRHERRADGKVVSRVKAPREVKIEKN